MAEEKTCFKRHSKYSGLHLPEWRLFEKTNSCSSQHKRGDRKETGTMCLTLSACYLLTKQLVFAKSSSVKPEEALKET